ncbi:MAG TPA: hypothetical protein ENK43_15995 [Planctomycetes bacterium]|nr:hypothetical protein [Planctomycetota bacterium]
MKVDAATGIVVVGAGDPRPEPKALSAFLERWVGDERRYPVSGLRKPFIRARAKMRAHRRLEEAQRLVTVDSPFLRVAGAQANGVAEALGGEGYAVAAVGGPVADEVVPLMRAEGMRRAIVVAADPLSIRGHRLSDFAQFEEAWLAEGGVLDDLVFVEEYATHPAWQSALVALAKEGGPRDTARATWLFVAPGLPKVLARTEEDFAARSRALAEVLARDLGLPADRWGLAYLDPLVGDRGLMPSPTDLIGAWAKDSVRDVVVFPYSWGSDRLETLHKVDIELARQLRERAMRMFRIPCLNDHPELIAALSRIVLDASNEAPASLGGPRP